MELKIEDYQSFSNEFLQEYLSDGFGVMSKREIDILIMNLLMKYGDLAKKSNHELSLLLRVPESTIKRLRYDARLRYKPDDAYIQREFLNVLSKANFELERNEESKIENVKFIFVMEDNYLRYDIQGRLKDKGMFADTSFNSEIIKIGYLSLVAVISEICGEEVGSDFKKKFKSLNKRAELDGIPKMLKDFALDTLKSIGTAVVVSAIKPG